MVGPRVILSLSGGKDSTAAGLHLRELGIPFSWVFADTGWEHPETYRYVSDELPELFGPGVWVRSVPDLPDDVVAVAESIEAVAGLGPSPFVRWCLRKGMFPSRQRRYCTDELKWNPIVEHLRGLSGQVVNVIGIRRAESQARSADPEWEVHPASRDIVTWRPLVEWSEQDVIDVHARHGVVPNRLYLHRASRVGCWPCIYARKDELAWLGESDPRRVTAIRMLEQAVGDLAEARYAERGETLESLGYHRPKLYQSHTPRREFRGVWQCNTCRKLWKGERREGGSWPWPPQACSCGAQDWKKRHTRSGAPVSIDDVLQWAATSDGRHVDLFGGPDGESGCMRWGLCEHPEASSW